MRGIHSLVNLNRRRVFAEVARLPIDPTVAEAYDNGMMETVYTDDVDGVIEAVLKA